MTGRPARFVNPAAESELSDGASVHDVEPYCHLRSSMGERSSSPAIPIQPAACLARSPMHCKISKTRITMAGALCALLGVTSIATFARHVSSATEDPDDSFDSPRLAALARALAAADAAANRRSIDAFLKELQGKGPLIEPTADDRHSS